MPRLLHHLILPVMGVSFCATSAWAAEEATFWRLFVADHAKPLVTAIDLGTDHVSGSFELGSPASLYTTPSQAGVYAVQGDADRVSAIASGIALDDHGDHADLDVVAPQLLDAAVVGDKPVHFVEHRGDIALFFDGEGVARLLSERDWLAGDATTRDLKVAAPHHGVAAPVGEYTLISRPNIADPTALPVGIDVYGADRVVIIDPSAAEPFRLVDLPSRRVHFAIDPQRVKYAYLFTEDGTLHRLDVVSGAIDRTLPLTRPYSMDGEWSLPRPRLAVAGDHIAVTDPLAGTIHLVDAETFARARDIPVTGTPYNIAAVGGSGASHE